MADIKKLENAIETIKSLVFCGNCTTGDCKNCDRFKAKNLAIETLQEKLDHEKQLELLKKGKIVFSQLSEQVKIERVRQWAIDEKIQDKLIELLKQENERKNPKPLTLEELKQMEGEPVWVHTPYNKKGYWDMIVEFDDYYDIMEMYKSDYIEYEKIHTEELLFYRHKPKEE